jgi:hypothetical protein
MDWAKLAKVGFPNRTRGGFLRVWVKYLILAIVNYPKKGEFGLKTSVLKSNMWNSLNMWLQFQIRFISPRDWAASPAILAVAGGYSEKNDLSGLMFSEIDKATAKKLAQKYLEGFRGFQHKDYESWILKVLALLRAAENMTEVSLVNSTNCIAEIGPGMACMAGIAQASSTPSFYSYDTLEMQIIQRYVTKFFDISETEYIYFPINSEKLTLKADLPTSHYVLFAFWSFTEVNISERAYYYALIRNSYVTIIACNNSFEGVNNFEFLENLAVKLGKEIQYTDLLTILGPAIPRYQQMHRLYTFKNLPK